MTWVRESGQAISKPGRDPSKAQVRGDRSGLWKASKQSSHPGPSLAACVARAPHFRALSHVVVVVVVALIVWLHFLLLSTLKVPWKPEDLFGYIKDQKSRLNSKIHDEQLTICAV